ncbi:hypothetical protein D3C71_909930 [compost metagenome]
MAVEYRHTEGVKKCQRGDGSLTPVQRQIFGDGRGIGIKIGSRQSHPFAGAGTARCRQQHGKLRVKRGRIAKMRNNPILQYPQTDTKVLALLTVQLGILSRIGQHDGVAIT